MTNIILSILTFLLMLFPNCTRLQVEYRTRIVARDVTAGNIVRAMNERDIDALEAMMCLNIKQNTGDLPGKIGEMLDMINGEISDYSWERAGGDTITDGKGHRINQNYLVIDIITATEQYLLVIVLETYNNLEPKEMGIRCIDLAINDDPLTAESFIYRIAATKGLYGDYFV